MHSEWLSNMRIYINSVTLLINSSFFFRAIGRAQFSLLSSSPSSIWLGFLLSSFVIKIADMKNEMISSHSPQRIELVQTLFFCAWIGVFVSVMSANNAITRCCFCVSLRFKSNYKHNSNAHHTSKPYVGGKNKIPITKERKISNSQQRK